MIQWPRELRKRTKLAEKHVPRLLMVEGDAAAPSCGDPLEDWVRLPARIEDVEARVRDLIARTRVAAATRVHLDANGIAHHGLARIQLTPHQARLLAPLAKSFGVVVSRDELLAALWPGKRPANNTLDAHVARLRRRLVAHGLRIRTVRSRGYILESAEPGS